MRHRTPTSYSEAETFLAGGRNKEQRTVANNTVIRRLHGDRIALRLHRTDIVTWFADGTIKLTNGGWRTPTTLSRLREALPSGIGIDTVKGDWLLHNLDGDYVLFVHEAWIQEGRRVIGDAGLAYGRVFTSSKPRGTYETVSNWLPLRDAYRLVDEVKTTALRVKVATRGDGDGVLWAHSVPYCEKRSTYSWALPCPICDRGLYIHDIEKTASVPA